MNRASVQPGPSRLRRVEPTTINSNTTGSSSSNTPNGSSVKAPRASLVASRAVGSSRSTKTQTSVLPMAESSSSSRTGVPPPRASAVLPRSSSARQLQLQQQQRQRSASTASGVIGAGKITKPSTESEIEGRKHTRSASLAGSVAASRTAVGPAASVGRRGAPLKTSGALPTSRGTPTPSPSRKGATTAALAANSGLSAGQRPATSTASPRSQTNAPQRSPEGRPALASATRGASTLPPTLPSSKSMNKLVSLTPGSERASAIKHVLLGKSAVGRPSAVSKGSTPRASSAQVPVEGDISATGAAPAVNKRLPKAQDSPVRRATGGAKRNENPVGRAAAITAIAAATPPAPSSSSNARSKRWSTWTGDTAVNSDHRPSSASDEPDHEPGQADVPQDSDAIGRVVVRRSSDVATDLSSTDAEAPSLFSARSHDGADRRRAKPGTFSSSRPTTPEGTRSADADTSEEAPLRLEDHADEVEDDDNPALDALLMETMHALEVSNALVISTLSSRHELARLRAYERALDTTMTQREAELQLQLQGNRMAMQWVEKANADMQGLLDMCKVLGIGSKGSGSGMTRTMSDMPTASASMVSPQFSFPAQLSSTLRPSASPASSSHWRMPSFSNPLVSPSIGGGNGLMGIVEAKDENATIGKTAARRLEKVLKRTIPTAPSAEEGQVRSDHHAADTASEFAAKNQLESSAMSGPVGSGAASHASLSNTSSALSSSTLGTVPLASPLGSLIKAPPPPPSAATMTTQHDRIPSQPGGSKIDGTGSGFGLRRGRNVPSLLTGLASRSVSTASSSSLADAFSSQMMTPDTSVRGGGGPIDPPPVATHDVGWSTVSPMPSMSKGRVSSMEALQHFSALKGLGRMPSNLAPSEAGSGSVRSSVIYHDDDDEDDRDDGDSVADSTASGAISTASGLRLPKRLSGMSVRSPSLATRAEGHRSSASLSMSLQENGIEGGLVSMLNAEESGRSLSGASSASKGGTSSSRADSTRLGAMAALQKLNANAAAASNQPTLSLASPTAATTAGWATYMPFWLSTTGASQPPQSPQSPQQPSSVPPLSPAALTPQRPKREEEARKELDSLLADGGDATTSPQHARKLSQASSFVNKRTSLIKSEIAR